MGMMPQHQGLTDMRVREIKNYDRNLKVFLHITGASTEVGRTSDILEKQVQ